MDGKRRCVSCGREFWGLVEASVCPRCLLEGVQEVLASEHGAAPGDAGLPHPSDETVPGAGPVARESGALAHAAREAPGRYTAAREHARGGMGRILIAHDEQLGRDVVIKELLPEACAGSLTEPGTPDRPLRESTPMAARFVREARIAGQLEHPGVVPVHELGIRESGELYYTMKLVRGRSLSEAIREASNLAERLKLLPHVVDVCQAVAYAHSRGVIHRDIKPANVMVGEFGETVIIDWGLARVRKGGQEERAGADSREIDTGPAEDGRQTMRGQVLGTPAYMAPEQAQGRTAAVNERTDIYALGALLYTLLSGQPPYRAGGRDEILRQAAAGAPESILAREPDAPPELVAICRKAMGSDPAQRYPSARIMAEELQRFLTGGLVAAYEYRFRERLRRFICRNLKVFVTAGVGLGIVVLLAVGSYVRIVFALNHAVEARSEAIQARDEVEEQLYSTSIAFAQAAVETGHPYEAERAILAAPTAYRHWEWGLLAALSHPDLLTLIDPESHAVWYPTFSPDGRYIASGNGMGTLRLWDAATGSLVRSLKWDERSRVWPLFSPDSRFVAVCLEDGWLKVCELESGIEVQAIRVCATSSTVTAFSPSGDTLATADVDRSTCNLWNVPTGRRQLALDTPGHRIRGVAFSPDGKQLATAGHEGIVRVWDVDSGREVMRLTGHKGALGYRCVSYSPDGRWIATGGVDRTVRLWDAKTGEIIRVLEGHKHEICTVKFSPDGQRLLTSARDRTVALWGVPDGQRQQDWSGIVNGACDVDFTRLQLVTSIVHEDERIGIVRGLDAPHDVLELRGHTGPIMACVFSADSTLLASGAGQFDIQDDNRAIVWDVATGHSLSILEGHGGPVNRVAFLSCGERLLTGSADGTVGLWDVRSGQRIRSYTVESVVRALVVTPDERRFITSGWDDNGRIRVWDIETGQLLRSLDTFPDAKVDGLAIDPRGQFLGAVVRYGATVIWTLDSFVEVTRFEYSGSGSSFNVDPLAFSCDARALAVEEDSRGIRLLGIPGWNRVGYFTGHTEGVVSLSFHPKGGRLVSSAQDGSVRLWDTASSREVLLLNNQGPVAFSPDGKILATADGPTVLLQHAFPWREEEFPGDATMAFRDRIQLARKEREQYVSERERDTEGWRRASSERQSCHARLLQLDNAKLAWALAADCGMDDAPEDLSSILGYLGDRAVDTKCPAGGQYTLGSVAELPRCSKHGSPAVNPSLQDQVEAYKGEGHILMAVFLERCRGSTGVGAMYLNDLAWHWAAVDNTFYRPAIQLAERALELAPDAGKIWDTLAYAELVAGDTEKSVAHFRVALNKGYRVASHGLALALLQRGREADLAEACGALERELINVHPYTARAVEALKKVATADLQLRERIGLLLGARPEARRVAR